jgi:hypothetical protein
VFVDVDFRTDEAQGVGQHVFMIRHTDDLHAFTLRFDVFQILVLHGWYCGPDGSGLLVFARFVFRRLSYSVPVA